MKVTFVAMGTEQLPISLLSAILKRDGHEVGLAFSASLFNDRFNLEIESLGKFFDDRNEVIKAIVKQCYFKGSHYLVKAAFERKANFFEHYSELELNQEVTLSIAR